MKEGNRFVVGNEYGTGIWIENGVQKEWVKDAPVKAPSAEWNKKLGLCNGFRIVGDINGLTAEEIEKLSEGGKYFVMIDLFRCHPETIDIIMGLMKEGKYGKMLWGTLFGERDGNYHEWTETYPEYFRNRKEAADYFKKWLCEKAIIWRDKNDPSGPRWWYFRDQGSKPLPLKTFANHLKSNKFPDWANLAAHSSALYVLHHYYEWGLKFVWLERSAWFPNLQLGIAFLRGAANQYQGFWGIDFSSWGGLFSVELPRLPVHYDAEGKRLAGAEPDYLLRGWLVTFLSGADFDFQEVTDLGYVLPQEEGEEWELSPLGEKAKEFADFALRRHPEGGKPYVPFALILEHDHGWDAPRWQNNNFVWGNKVPYEQGDYMIENFFEAAFPGYKVSSGSYEKNWNPEVPWKSEEEYFEMLHNGYDMRPFNKGKITSSRWGDSFDVLLENASMETIKEYKVIALLGRIKLNSDLASNLKEYVKEGGTLVLSGKQLGEELSPEEIKDFTGIEVLAPWSEIYGPSRCEICNRTFEELRFEYTPVKLKGAKVLATNHRREPIITEHKIGKGKVIYIVPYYGQELRSLSLLNITTHILDHIYGEHQLVKIEGAPIEYLVNRNEKGLWVSLINNENTPWEGKVEIKVPSYVNEGKVKEIWEEKDIHLEEKNSSLVFKPSVEPLSFKIFEIR